MRKVIALLLFFCFQQVSFSQNTLSEEDNTNIYKIYADQIGSLLAVRGVPASEISELKAIFNKNNIKSDQQFAKLLSKLYPANNGIGFLFYFYNNDSLHRVFIEPGNVIEKKIITITKEQLLQTGYDINHVIGLYKESTHSTPSKRGVIIETPDKTKGADYLSVIKTLTSLLLPESFTNKYQHLIIIPAMNIGTFPFALLQPYDNDTLLIEKCSYTIVPSLIDLLGLRIKTLKKNTKWMGDISRKFEENYDFKNVTPVSFIIENGLFISNPLYPRNTEFIFPDLPGAKKEITIAKTYARHYKLLEGKNAIKDSVINYLKESDLAYFATHGIADSENPMENSFLVLSGNNPFLTAKDIMDFRNNKEFENKFPEMVILSACQTGLGKAMEAGVAGLARSFLLAGSNHVVMSLWNVDDEATAYLMNRFVYLLQQKNQFTPSEPLRKAMLDARKKFPSPAQWASFALFGIDF